MNKVVFLGRVATKPESNVTRNGTETSRFRLAVRSTRRRDDGQNDADFFTIVAFGQTANIINTYCNTGDMIALEGRLQVRDFERQDGSTGTSVEVVANQIHFAGRGNTYDASDEQYAGAVAARQPVAAGSAVSSAPVEMSDEDIPF